MWACRDDNCCRLAVLPLLGLSLADLLRAKDQDQSHQGGGPGWGKAKSVILRLPARRPQPSGSVGSQGRRAGQRPQRVQADRDQDARHGCHGVDAEVRPGHRQGDVDPLDELHAGRPVQSHGGHLSDAHRLHGGQGQPVGPIGAAVAQRLSRRSARRSFACSRRSAHAAVRDDAATAAGEQRCQQGGHAPASWAAPSIRITCSRRATIWT